MWVDNPFFGPTSTHLRYEFKRGKYEAEANQNNHKFLPIVFESTGRMHPESLKFLRKVGAEGAQDEHEGEEDTALFNYFMTSLSVCLQRGLANAYIQGRARVHGSGAERNQRYDSFYRREEIAEYAHMRNGEV